MQSEEDDSSSIEETIVRERTISNTCPVCRAILDTHDQLVLHLAVGCKPAPARPASPATTELNAVVPVPTAVYGSVSDSSLPLARRSAEWEGHAYSVGSKPVGILDLLGDNKQIEGPLLLCLRCSG
jgi:hypothetical protein